VDQSADHGSKGLDEGSPSRFRLGFLARATVERVRGVPHRNVPQRLTPGYFGAFHYHAINDLWKAGISLRQSNAPVARITMLIITFARFGTCTYSNLSGK